MSDLSLCSIGLNCSELPAVCITCNFNYSCIYGQMQSVTCDARPNVQCHVSIQVLCNDKKDGLITTKDLKCNLPG